MDDHHSLVCIPRVFGLQAVDWGWNALVQLLFLPTVSCCLAHALGSTGGHSTGATLAPPLTGPNIALLFDLIVARNGPHSSAFNSL